LVKIFQTLNYTVNMMLSTIDIIVVLVYLITMILLGFILKKRAQRNKESYLLGGKKIPWYMLGMSNASDMFDISGTMWMVTLAFVYGLKSIWIPWLWPVFNQIFLMMYLSIWLRRSNATTGAEWLRTRFGLIGKSVRSSHAIVVIFALISCLGFLAYGFVGLGKFVEIFVPWESIKSYVPFTVAPTFVPHFYGIVFSVITMIYAIMGGMTSIVIGDVVKYIIMSVAAIVIAVIAADRLAGQELNVPEGWLNPFFGWTLDLDWTNHIAEVNQKIKDDGFTLFGVFFMMMLFKGIFASLAGPAPNYDMQKILSTKSPKDAAKMSGLVSVILLPIRYAMIMGFAVLGILYYDQLDLSSATGVDFEKILPAAIVQFVPVGLTGLLLAGLLAAFMGTFAGTLNAAQAYIVNDIYLKYFEPKASNIAVRNMNYLSGIVVASLGIILGLFVKDVNSILQWIVSALYGGYIASNVLKWHWWRFNANGFFWGMLAGIIPALIFPIIFDTLDLYYFPLLFFISFLGCIVGTYTAPPTDIEVLKSFYKTIKPWGFWKPIRKMVEEEEGIEVHNKNFGKDMFNITLGIIGQLCLTLLPMYLVLKAQIPLYLTILILILIISILKKTWWNKLEN
jgi:SSS family solute:Na+ symporter